MPSYQDDQPAAWNVRGPVPPGYPAPASTNGLAIASLVLGIVWLYGLGSILALIFGYIAKGQIDRSGGRQSGRGLAVAGIVLGWVGTAGVIAITVLVFGLLAPSTSTSRSSVSPGPAPVVPAVPPPAASAPPTAEPVAAGQSLAAWACPRSDGSSPRTDTFPGTPPPMCINAARSYVAHVSTSEGPVVFAFDTARTPATANNFIVLALYHYYDGTTIDRIDTGLDILQTGSPKTQDIADPGPGYTINDEGHGFHYGPGDVVMARTASPDSASAQYFFVSGPKASILDSQGTYVTFGHVTTGLDVLQRIENLFVACLPSNPTCLGGAPGRIVTINRIAITSS